MKRYKVSAKGMSGKRIKTDKYWTKKSNAQRYADETNEHRPCARARVIKG